MLTIKDLEEKLPKSAFIRVHRSYLVAIDKIEGLEGNEILVKDGRIPLGVTYRNDFYELIKDKIVNKKTDNE